MLERDRERERGGGREMYANIWPRVSQNINVDYHCHMCHVQRDALYTTHAWTNDTEQALLWHHVHLSGLGTLSV